MVTPRSFCHPSTAAVSFGASGQFSLSVLFHLGRGRQMGFGPSVAFINKDAGPWVFGAVVNNIWSFGDTPPGSSDSTNQLLLNPFISYHFGDGWSLGSSPDITANWIASGKSGPSLSAAVCQRRQGLAVNP